MKPTTQRRTCIFSSSGGLRGRGHKTNTRVLSKKGLLDTARLGSEAGKGATRETGVLQAVQVNVMPLANSKTPTTSTTTNESGGHAMTPKQDTSAPQLSKRRPTCAAPAETLNESGKSTNWTFRGKGKLAQTLKSRL